LTPQVAILISSQAEAQYRKSYVQRGFFIGKLRLVPHRIEIVFTRHSEDNPSFVLASLSMRN
jgi:hypothetical protein